MPFPPVILQNGSIRLFLSCNSPGVLVGSIRSISSGQNGIVGLSNRNMPSTSEDFSRDCTFVASTNSLSANRCRLREHASDSRMIDICSCSNSFWNVELARYLGKQHYEVVLLRRQPQQRVTSFLVSKMKKCSFSLLFLLHEFVNVFPSPLSRIMLVHFMCMLFSPKKKKK